MTNNSLSVVPKQLSRDFTASVFFEFLGDCCKAVSECTLDPCPLWRIVLAGGFAAADARVGGGQVSVSSCMASLLAALLTLACFAVPLAGGGALFAGPALLEVAGGAIGDPGDLAGG